MKENNEAFIRRGVRQFIFGCILSVSAFLFIIFGAITGDLDLVWTDYVALAGFLSFLVVGLIFMIKSYPAVMLHEEEKLNDKYEKMQLCELFCMQKEEVQAKLQSNECTFEEGYYKIKKFSFLKDSVTYYFRMADSNDLESTIEGELEKFDRIEKKQRNNCLILLLYLDQISMDEKEKIKEFGKVGIINENIIDPNLSIAAMLVAIDNADNKGYFLPVRGNIVSLYAHCCRTVKRIFA